MRNSGDLHCMPYNLGKMCMHAVDRSEGHLVDINIEYFGTDELLLYIADRYNTFPYSSLYTCTEVLFGVFSWVR